MNPSRTEFQKIIDDNKKMVYNLSIGFLGNKEDAEDMTHDIFLHLYEKYYQFNNNSSLKTWVYRIVVNKNLEELRKRKTRRLKAQGLVTTTIEFDHPGISLENQELATKLYQAVSQLPENQQTAFTLVKLEGLAYKEISEIMGKSISSVESLLFRANENLRKILKEYYLTTYEK